MGTVLVDVSPYLTLNSALHAGSPGVGATLDRCGRPNFIQLNKRCARPHTELIQAGCQLVLLQLLGCDVPGSVRAWDPLRFKVRSGILPARFAQESNGEQHTKSVTVYACIG